MKEFQKHFRRCGIKFLACFWGKIYDGISTVGLRLPSFLTDSAPKNVANTFVDLLHKALLSPFQSPTVRSWTVGQNQSQLHPVEFNVCLPLKILHLLSLTGSQHPELVMKHFNSKWMSKYCSENVDLQSNCL